MTGRDLIMYILKHGLENEQIVKEDNTLNIGLFFMTADETAVKFKTGYATVRLWCTAGVLPYLVLNPNAENEEIYIPKNVKDPRGTL